MMSLELYRKKRNFARTPEPESGDVRATHKGHLTSSFVIQKHHASRLHYDLRLEMGGTLVSWAVPKGLPMIHGGKRLAVKVEDHPLSYAGFEGIIPAGEYGGGTVMVWDQGTYTALSEHPAKELAGGKLHFVLSGKKLEGEWYLVRLREENQWLVVRGGPDHKVIPAKKLDASVLSGKTLAQLAGKEPKPKTTKAAAKSSRRDPAERPVSETWLEPMLAKLVAEVPQGDWEYEIKFDGYRGLARKDASGTVLLSRNRNDLTIKFPEIAEAVSALKASQLWIDGEVVALDAEGRSSFALLQGYEQARERPPLYFYAFDLLELDGESLSAWPLEKRKARLQKLIPSGNGVLRFSPLLGRDAPALMEMAREHRLEGLIGKRVGSVYEPGKRSGTWIKLKQITGQEFVIGGYTPPAGARADFGALLVGYYEDGKLRYAGKVGTGFTGDQLSAMLAGMKKIAATDCPFDPPPAASRGRYGTGFTAAEWAACHWLKPKLVAQVKFSGWTPEGRLRHPVFLGLRSDKPARTVVREPAPTV